MKQLNFLILSLLLSFGSAFSQSWTWNSILDGYDATKSMPLIHMYPDGFGWHVKNSGSTSTFHITTDGGKNWKLKSSPATLPFSFPDVESTSQNSIYALAVDASKEKIRITHSKDQGETWQTFAEENISANLNIFQNGGGTNAFSVLNGNLIAGIVKVYKQGESDLFDLPFLFKDNGSTFINVLDKFSSIDFKTVYDIAFVSNNVGLMSTNKGVYKTTDGGDTWTEVINESSDNGKISMVNEMTFYVGLHKGSMEKTTDGGATWTTLTLPLEVSFNAWKGANTIDFIDESCGAYIGRSKRKTYFVFRTNDGGNSWVKDSLNDGLVNYDAGDVLFPIYIMDCNTMFVSTRWQIFSNKSLPFGGDVGVSNSRNEKIKAFPNPSNSNINIDITGNVNIEVHNTLGKLLYRGNNKIIEVIDWPSGIYIASIKSNSKTITTKFLVQH